MPTRQTTLTARRRWMRAHTLYLRSAEWAARRAAVMARDRWRCKARLMNCQERATQVHHLTYRHWKNEPLFDLIAVCESCHKKITTMERKRGFAVYLD